MPRRPALLNKAWALRESLHSRTRIVLWCGLLIGLLAFWREPLAQITPQPVAAPPESPATQEPSRAPADDALLQGASPSGMAGNPATAATSPTAGSLPADSTAPTDDKAGPQRSWLRIVHKDGTELVGWVRLVVPGQPVTVESEPDRSAVIPWDDIQQIAAAPTPLLLNPQVAPIGTLDPFHAGILLNDGTLVGGTVTSYLPGQSVTVRTPIGNSTVIAWGMIARIQRFPSVPLAHSPTGLRTASTARSSGFPKGATFAIVLGGVALTVGGVVGAVAGIDYLSKHPPVIAFFPSFP